MRAIAGGLVGIMLCAESAGAADEKFAPSGSYVCTGEFTFLEYDAGARGFRTTPLRDIKLDVRTGGLTMSGDFHLTGNYVIKAEETSPIQIFFTASRERRGAFGKNGVLYVSAPRGTQPPWKADLKCTSAP